MGREQVNLIEAIAEFADTFARELRKNPEGDVDEFVVEEASNEMLQEKVKALEIEKEKLQGDLRRITRILQNVFSAHQLMHDALYQTVS